jgi:alpha-1,3-mannosyltransferase
MKQKWNWAAVFYSIGLSIKMNLLLFSPGLALIYYQSRGILGSLVSFMVVLLIQFIFAYPFWDYLDIYFKNAFDFSRTFLYTWTVNWKMIPENIFYQSWFSNVLILIHVLVLVMFICKWCRLFGGVQSVFLRGLSPFIQNNTCSNECIIYII